MNTPNMEQKKRSDKCLALMTVLGTDEYQLQPSKSHDMGVPLVTALLTRLPKTTSK